MRNNVNPKVKMVMNNAIREAKNHDDDSVKPEHIILAIMNDGENICVNALRLMGLDSLDVYDFVSDFIRKNDLKPRIKFLGRSSTPLSDEVKTILKNLSNQNSKLNENYIDLTHLFLTVLEDKKLPIVKALKDLNLTYENLLQTIKNMDKEYKNNVFSGDDEFQATQRPSTNQPSKSKTPVLDNFCRDISKSVEKGQIDPVVGREIEIKRVSQILSRRKKNNPVIIGDPGVGKCFTSDTHIVMRNDITNEIIRISVSDFIKHFLNPE